MTDIALTVEGLSKRYRIGERTQAYQTLRDSLTGLLLTPYHRIRMRLQTADETSAGENLIWALKDVSFEVRRGEVIGIIGRKRCRQEHAAEDSLPRNRADHRVCGVVRPRGISA
jgi:lipopolysaccharide transport system ATP-binding protein